MRGKGYTHSIGRQGDLTTGETEMRGKGYTHSSGRQGDLTTGETETEMRGKGNTILWQAR